MARKKKELPLLEQVEITGVAAEGKALARVNDLVVFVPFAAPGDIVDLQLMRKKHNYAEARIVKFHAYSSLRVNPFLFPKGTKIRLKPFAGNLTYKRFDQATIL